MASSPAPFSDEFAATARAEAARLSSRAVELRARGERWVQRGSDLLREAERLEQRLRDLDELLGRAPQLRLDLQSRRLQGQRLREEAARILLERRGLKTPTHYRDWFRFLDEAGLIVVGKDPLATFLTQITRSPLVVRVDSGQGVYELDPHGAYDRARIRVQEALADLSAVTSAQRNGDDRVAAEAAVDRARHDLAVVLEAKTLLLRERMGHAVGAPV